MRKSIDGLAIMVSESLELDPLSSSLFVFCNRQRHKKQSFALPLRT